MAKLTQAEVKAKADEWAGLQKKIGRAEAARNAEIDPFLIEFNERTEPIRKKHEGRIFSLRTQADEIEAEVLGWLNGVGKPIALAGELAVAANEATVGRRVIDVKKFLDFLHTKGRGVYDCVTVLVAKAELLLGKTAVDEISTKETKLLASLKMK